HHVYSEKMRSVGTLAGGVAHQFNNLLAGIQGYATLCLREPGISEGLQHYLQLILELSDRAANVTRQLQTFARQPALIRRPINVVNLLNATAEMVRRSLGIAVSVEVQDSANDGQAPHISADAGQLQQVLIHLSQNARDALARVEPIEFRLQCAVL